PHLLDQALMLFGMPQAINAQCRNMRPGSTTNDYFNLILHYPEHLVHLHGNMYSPEPNLRYKVLGTLGKYEKYGLDPQEQCLKDGVEPNASGWAKEEESSYGKLYLENESHTITTEHGCYEMYFKAVASA